jgi:hypothetical protein
VRFARRLSPLEIGTEHSRKERQDFGGLMEHSSRYLIGVDLGTTNSVVAYIDTEQASQNGHSEISLLEIPQIVGFGEVRALPSLPSFLYFPTEDESEGDAIRLPWDEHPQSVAGAIARDHGALVPTRQVMSAKSWLSHGGVDRRARILPREADPPLASPVEASARYLEHLRRAWNHVFAVEHDPNSAFEKQEIVLTVPASFDEEARELTVEAARQAGLDNFILLEEPLAAFYAWTATHQQQLSRELNDGDLVLICDIGGGTTDFSLVRAHVDRDQVQFERKAIGEHLLLGGDNFDLALARRIEERLNAKRLSTRQRHALQRACCAAKERLLSDPALLSVPVTILGGGRAVVGQMLTGELHRDEVLDILTRGFLPLTAASELPRRGTSAGLRELGLPYAGDPAITKHLAAFLRQAAVGMKSEAASNSAQPQPRIACPDAILFNGGFCEPPVARERIVEAVATWFDNAEQGWRPRVLRNDDMGSAVAKGAAHYGRVRRGQAVRIRAGSARTYYIGLRSEQGLQGVCVVPSGVEEGTTLPLANRDFAALANRPVSFALFSSRIRHDAHGEVANLEGEQVHRHAPLVTLLRYGKKLREQELAVRLQATFTEVGTLELWCESVNSPHRWRLQFELRGEQPQLLPEGGAERKQAAVIAPVTSPSTADEAVEASVRLIRSVFSGGNEPTEDAAPETLAGKLEASLGIRRDAWPADLLRRFSDVLIEVAEGRRKTTRHEVRWLNLTGFCLRPGFGLPGDDRRVSQIRKLSLSGPGCPRELQCEVEWLVLLRRISGGLNASFQHELYKKLLPSLGLASKKKSRINAQLEHETWRLAASLEHLSASLRAQLGDELAARIRRDPSDTRWLWSLARLGARIPLYGPLSCVVPPGKAAEWLSAIIGLPEMSPETAQAVVQIGRSTGDRSRDVAQEVRDNAARTFKAGGVGDEFIRRLKKFVPPERSDSVRMFGESLPKDLPLMSSAECLLSVTALTPDVA